MADQRPDGMRSGLSANVTCGCDSMRIGAATARLDRVPGVPVRPASVNVPNAQFNPGAFRAPAPGTWGDVGRNVLKGPPAYNWDFSPFKDFRVAERQTAQFRAEIFNVFNTPQLGLPGANLNAPATFGRSTSTINTPAGFGTNCQIQFALRYQF